MTHYVGYIEVSTGEKEYFDNSKGIKIKLELNEISQLDLDSNKQEYEKFEEENDYMVEMEHIYDLDYNLASNQNKEDTRDRKVYKCEFIFQHRVDNSFEDYIIDDFTSMRDVKKWFLNQVDDLEKFVRDAADTEITISYINAYLRAIADLEENTIINIKDGFEIKCFLVDRNEILFPGDVKIRGRIIGKKDYLIMYNLSENYNIKLDLILDYFIKHNRTLSDEDIDDIIDDIYTMYLETKNRSDLQFEELTTSMRMVARIPQLSK